MSLLRRALSLLTVLAIASGIGLFHAAPAAAALNEVYLTALHSGKQVVVLNARTNNNQPVIQWPGNNAAPDNDKIRLKHLTGNEYYLQAVHSNKCLVVKNASFALYARIIQFSCDATDPWDNDVWLQEMVIVHEGSQTYQFPQFRNKSSRLCMAVLSASTANGAEIVQYTCNQSRNSIFRSYQNAAN